ncbi:MAG: sigma-70 family RNA polymerase sigma factor [Gaiellaceae bacterium]
MLAQRARTDRAFERLYQKYAGDVYRYALVVLRNPSDAEDVTQTTFMNAYRAFSRGERPRLPQNWVMTIAHNVCRQRFRQSARRPNELPLEQDVAEIVPEDTGPSADDIRRALGHLAFNQRSALVMRELEGRSYAEIAEILGLTTSAVETLIFRARRALREQLEGGLTCTEAELAISKQLDGKLPRKERGSLRAHLRECDECARFARSQRAQSSAIKALAAIPLPASLASFFHHGAGAGAAAGASAGAGIAAKVALVGATAVVATGVGYTGAREAGWHPLRHHHQAATVAAPVPKPAVGAAVILDADGVRGIARPTDGIRGVARPKNHATPPGLALGHAKQATPPPRGKAKALGHAKQATPPPRGKAKALGHKKKAAAPLHPVHPSHPVKPAHPVTPPPPVQPPHPVPPPHPQPPPPPKTKTN